jgi:serpin B
LAPFLLGACAVPATQPTPSTDLSRAPSSTAARPTGTPIPQPQRPAEPQSRPEVRQDPRPPTAAPAELAIAKANRAFAVSLYRQLAVKPGNVFISPISIGGAFGPAAAGARGPTRAEIGKVLHFPADDEVLNDSLGSILRTLESGGDGPQVSIANALWLGKEWSIEPDFVDLAKRSYDAEIDTLDFHDSRAAAARINAWVDRETSSRIPELFKPDAFDPTTAVVVTNAVYFLGDWKVQFDPRRTRPQPFFLADGTTREVPMMVSDNMVARCLCAEEPRGAEVRPADAADVIELPYKGDRLSMVLVLPVARNGLPAVEARLSADRLDEWLTRLDSMAPFGSSGDFNIVLPKVRLERSYDLVKPLQALGMKLPFIPGRADFAGISTDRGNPLYINAVVHKTFLNIDEKGTEAAAATGIEFRGERDGPPVFRADHPFLFLIRDKQTGAILFLGRIAEP